ncbi:MAG: tRNA (adenosine(37)-N6)-dimethylallyltransferase MiaA [Acidobacteriota bacterium]
MNSVAALIAIAGPTASGKSRLAVDAALEVGGEIVNCDSMQLYRKMEIGTAKPAAEERRLVPHHLYGIIDPDEYYSAGRYMTEARRICREIAQRGKIPVVVGGTGLYLRAFVEGVFQGPGRSEEVRRRIRAVGDQKGFDYLYRLLFRKDPEAARKISSRDHIRMVRALEIYFLTGEPISSLKPSRKALKDFKILKIGLNLPRPILYARINRRVEEMFWSGLLDEVRELLASGYALGSKGFEALGYRQALAVLKGELTRDQAIELTQRDTRRYAKRQMTWFRREQDMHWITEAGEEPAALEQLLQLYRTL